MPASMIKINGEPIQEDIDYVQGLYPQNTLVESHTAPITYKGGKLKLNPHITQFKLEDGKYMSVFHVKPVYYENKNGSWNSLSEVSEEFGNRYIKLKAGWRNKMSGKYLRWISKRMEIINGNNTEDLVLEKDQEGNPLKKVPRGLSEKVGTIFTRIPKVAIEAMYNNPNF
jgi:hypothetical protein